MKKVLSLLTAAALAALNAASANVRLHGALFYGGRGRFAVQTLVWTAAGLLVWTAFQRLAGKRDAGERRFFRWRKKDLVLTALALTGVWYLYLLVFAPGASNADTANEILDFVTGKTPMSFQWYGGLHEVSASLNDHHPVFDTLVFSAFYRLGQLAGDASLGLLAYNLVQVPLMALAAAAVICLPEKLGAPAWVSGTGFFFLAGAPFVGMYAVTMIKDSLHAIVFLFYLAVLVLLVYDGPSRGRLTALIVLSLLMALTKKTGIYMTVLTGLCLLLVPSLRKAWKQVLASVLLPALVIFVLMGRILFPLLDVYPGGSQEAIGNCLQMAAACAIRHGEDLTEEEIRTIDAVFPYDQLEEAYDPSLVDGVKKLYRFECTGEERSALMKLLGSFLVRYPLDCLEAELGVVGGFFSPTAKDIVYTEPAVRGVILSRDPYEEYWIEWKSMARMDHVRECALSVYDWARNDGILSAFFYIVIYVWWIPWLCLGQILSARNWKALAALMPIILSTGILILCPYSGYRYALPQVMALPLVMGTALMERKDGPGPA